MITVLLIALLIAVIVDIYFTVNNKKIANDVKKFMYRYEADMITLIENINGTYNKIQASLSLALAKLSVVSTDSIVKKIKKSAVKPKKVGHVVVARDLRDEASQGKIVRPKKKPAKR